jgi:bacillithiol system protein YtxJ
MTTPLTDRKDLEAALAGPLFLLFKHSRRCPISARAFAQYEQFVTGHPDVPTGFLDVIADRPMSQWVAAQYGVLHQSPQALLFRGGRVVWDASHRGVTADAIWSAVKQ